MHSEAQQWIDTLGLSPHPEGGYFLESYRDSLVLSAQGLGQSFDGARSASTAIYYLLEGEDFSALHRIRSDELWHFYAGSALRVEGLHADGRREDWLLHNNCGMGRPQVIVPRQTWFGARLVDPTGFALVGCTVSPGFDFSDFEMANTTNMIARYPQHREWIQHLTR